MKISLFINIAAVAVGVVFGCGVFCRLLLAINICWGLGNHWATMGTFRAALPLFVPDCSRVIWMGTVGRFRGYSLFYFVLLMPVSFLKTVPYPLDGPQDESRPTGIGS